MNKKRKNQPKRSEIPPSEEPIPNKVPENHGLPMDFNDRHTQYAPAYILDEDNGLDFTFEGMGLKGNR